VLLSHTSTAISYSYNYCDYRRGLLSSFDAFLWFRPARARTSDALSFSPMRSTVALKEYMRFSVLLGQVKRCLRHAVPMERMVAIASSSDTQVGSGRPVDRSKDEGSQPSFDFSLFFHKVSTLAQDLSSTLPIASIVRQVVLRKAHLEPSRSITGGCGSAPRTPRH
jgi:hypothetical protein